MSEAEGEGAGAVCSSVDDGLGMRWLAGCWRPMPVHEAHPLMSTTHYARDEIDDAIDECSCVLG